MGAVNKRLSGDRTKNRPVDLAGWEWGMEEEADFDALDSIVPIEWVILRLDAVRDVCELVCRKPACKLWAGDEASKKQREEHEVVVLHPNHGVLADLLADDFGEAHISNTVGEPILLIKIHFSGMIVEQGP